MKQKTKILMISTVLVLALLSGVAVMAYANGGTNDTNALMTYANGVMNEANIAANAPYEYGDCYRGAHASFGRQRHGRAPGESITISQEFKDNVINITKSDSDVQKLLADGYNITGLRPIINTVVEADGTVTMKATNAIVTLCQNTTGRATVWVNIEQAKVTRIEILTRTVIEKP